MIGKYRTLVWAMALVAALTMLFGLSTFVLAGSDTPTAPTATVCVDGYVINHRELAVDGTKTTPPLEVMAVGQMGSFSAPVGKDGYFKFEKLPVGDWNFQMQLPEGWEGIVPQAERGGLAETGLTPLAEKKDCYRIVFKLRRLFEVVVIKWEEQLDGTVRPGEGWVITATPYKDPFVKAQKETTDKDGYAYFTLTPGRWTFTEMVKPGWKPITPRQVVLDLDQYAAPGAREPVVFKNQEPACYGTIIVEKIGYGTDPEGKEVYLGPLAGWKVTVSRADGAMAPVTKTTDGSGRVAFGHLPPGVYKVQEHLQVGWEALNPNPQVVIIRDCETVTVTFNNKETKGDMRIYGSKLFKAWTPPYKGQLVGLSGWTITAKLVGTDIMTTTVTNALGNYLFPEEQLVEAGIAFPGATVEVCEEDRENWIHVTPKCVKVRFPYPLPANFPGFKVDFTNIQDPPVTGATPNGVCRASHLIVKGDTLARIAARYGTTISALMQANRIRNPDVIYAGQTLCIP